MFPDICHTKTFTSVFKHKSVFLKELLVVLKLGMTGFETLRLPIYFSMGKDGNSISLLLYSTLVCG